MGKQWDPVEARLIDNWLRRHKGPKRVDSASRGEVRFARRRRLATSCQIGGNWYIIETAARAERSVAAELRDAGFEAYLPTYKIERENRRLRKTITSELVLFPRYEFVRAHVDQIAALRRVDGVVDILPGFPMAPVPIADADIVKLRTAQLAGLLDDTHQGRRARGDANPLVTLRKKLLQRQVLITDGPFASFPGVVEAVHSLDRLQVLVMLFGRETPVELEIGQIAA